jgi:hypothetical protein
LTRLCRSGLSCYSTRGDRIDLDRIDRDWIDWDRIDRYVTAWDRTD